MKPVLQTVASIHSPDFRLLTRRPVRAVDSGPGASRPCPKRRIAAVFEMELGELNV